MPSGSNSEPRLRFGVSGLRRMGSSQISGNAAAAGGEQQPTARHELARDEFALAVARMVEAAEERAVARTRADFETLRKDLLGLGKQPEGDAAPPLTAMIDAQLHVADLAAE